MKVITNVGSKLITLFLAITMLTSCFKDDDRGNSTISGRIIDSQTGEGIAGADVGFTKDNSISEVSDVNLKATTNAIGNFTITEAATGTYRMIIEVPGNFSRIIDGIEISDGINTLGDYVSVAPPSAGSIRIVLSWGLYPDDLDAHLTGPYSDESRFHIYYSYPETDDGNANLDVDDISSYGPETITINDFNDGTYRYSVFNFDDQSMAGLEAIFDSPAKVEVYTSNGLVNTFYPPATTGSEGNTWCVFEIIVDDGEYTIEPVNNYVYSDYSSAVTK